MQCHWLNREFNKNLLVFFAGWSFDWRPFTGIEPEDFDVLFVYDYNRLNVPEEFAEFSNYENKYLAAWSMGVFCAYLYYKRGFFTDFKQKIAINGTITPVDNNYGIPVKIFELTLKHAQKGLEEKFYKNVFLKEEEFEVYREFPVQRSIENRVSELNALYERIKENENPEYEKFYDLAYVSEFDKIIPPQNQTSSHNKNGTPVVSLPYGHFPFYYYTNWNEILKCKQTIGV